MTFKRFAQYLSQLEATSSRLDITKILSDLFKEAADEEIDKICYLLQGRVVPLYENVEMGVADKMMIKAIASGVCANQDEVLAAFKKEGDLSNAAFKIKNQKSKEQRINKKLTIIQVFSLLSKVALSSGDGSQEQKISLLADLIRQSDSLSACYIVRITLGKLRLGFSDMTMLDAFSWTLTGTKNQRTEIEKAYNVRPDMGYIGRTIKTKKMSGLSRTLPVIGTPIRMARADRLTSAKDILEKIGKCAVESKYDGLRVQIHYQKEKNIIKLFSRNLEDMTQMFPEIVASVVEQIKAKEVILEGEIVAYNPKTGVSIPFQQTMQRKRKYDIEKKVLEVPVRVYCFELLLCDGVDYIAKPYLERKKKLKEIIKEDKVLFYAREHIVDREQLIEDFFEKSISEGYEGIIAKRLDGVYQAGVRGWNWIKFKKGMSRRLMDTFDVLVMGYTYGEGKRTSFGVGQFLTGVFDENKDKFVTLTKIGTGLTDEQFRQFKKRIKNLEIKEKPANYQVDKLLEADVWLKPSLVVEVGADEITRSQVHTCGRIMGPSKSGSAQEVKTAGYALRFPRLIRFRDDKNPSEITTVEEVKKMWQSQEKKE